MTACPGQNHSYKLDVPFYTLSTSAQQYLSNPTLYHNGQHIKDVIMPFGKDSMPSKAIAMSLTHRWSCAWVAYSLDDLRDIYTYISSRFAQESTEQRPKYPCTGTMTRNEHGMIIVKGLRRLTDEEQRVARAARQMTHKAALPGQHPSLHVRAEEMTADVKQFQHAFLASYQAGVSENDDLPLLE